MIQRIIRFSVEHKPVVALFILAWIGAGLWSLGRVPIDAVPDITDNQVQVLTQAPDLGTEDIERSVTYSVELALANLPGVIELRSISRSGLSAVTVVFEERMGIYRPRQLVSEALVAVRDDLPEGVPPPFMAPISTGLGEIYQYMLVVDPAQRHRYDLAELRTLQEWVVARQMALVPGVVEVNSFGGELKQYHVSLDPLRLRSMDVTMDDVVDALRASNANTGGAYVQRDHMAFFIRGEGLFTGLDDIARVVVATRDGHPILVSDVGRVEFGAAIPYGAFTANGQGEAVGGIVMMLKGANSNDVIERVHQRMDRIRTTLPPGIDIQPFLDRSELIGRTTSTVRGNLLEGGLIVLFVLVLLLGNWRGGLIVASTIPLSLLFAFICMNAFGVWANLMSLGAIDFGIIVDGAVIIVEGTVFLLVRALRDRGVIDQARRDELAIDASSRMMRAAIFGQLIILIVFVPILGLQGVEGKMFRPMALTFLFAMTGVMILCLTYVPAVSAWALRAGRADRRSIGDRIVAWVEGIYETAIRRVLRAGWVLVTFALVLMATAVLLFSRMGGEFIPQLDEGDIAFHTLLLPGSGLDEVRAATTEVERLLLREFPEVLNVVSRAGVNEVPTDLMPMDAADCFIKLAPRDEWVTTSSKEALIDSMKRRLSTLPGLRFEFTQPIEMRFNELMTGVREDVAVKVFGSDLDVLARTAREIEGLVATVDGVGDLRVEATDGLPRYVVRPDREALARYGLHVDDVNRLVTTAFAGRTVGSVFEGERRFDLVVRLGSEHRTGPDDLRALGVPLPGGGQVPLGAVAQVVIEPGPMQISRENTERRTYVGINVRGRDVQSVVDDVRTLLDERLDLPVGYHLEYGGAFENLERATARLKMLVPVALVLILVMIYFALGSLPQTLMIFTSVPLAAVGGVVALWVRDMPFSISAGIGFIVLFGVAVLNGLVLLTGWNELEDQAADESLDDRIVRGAKRRIRPILLTALTDILGFLPMAISTTAGAEVQRPLATVVIGGMASATVLTLFLLPVLYRWLNTVRVRPAMAGAVTALLLMGVPWTAPAQDTVALSVDDVVQRLRTTPRIEAAHAEVDRALAEEPGAWRIGTTGAFVSGEEVSRDGGVFTLFGVQQQGIDVLGIGARRDLASARTEVARAGVERTTADIERLVRMAYVQAAAADERLRVLRSMDSLWTAYERGMELRASTGDVAELDLWSARARIEDNRRAIQTARAERAASVALLNRWLNGPQVIVPDGFDLPPAPPVLDGAGAHPLQAEVDRRVDLAERSVVEARRTGLPRLNLLYGIQSIDGTAGFHQFQAGVALPLSIPAQRSAVQVARVDVARADLARQDVQQLLAAKRTAAVERWVGLRDAWTSMSTVSLPVADRRRAAAWLAWRSGAADQWRVLEELEATVDTELQAIDLLERLHVAWIDLNHLHTTTSNQTP